MTSPFQKLAQKEYSQNPKSGKKNPYRSPFEQLADSPKYQEGIAKSFLRTVAQVPQGLLEATTPGIAAGLWQLLAQGEILDPEELDRIKEISARQGIPFDEEKYMEAARQALGTIPTVSNIAGAIEERTGIPLEAKTKLQKGVRLGSMAGGITPGTIGQKAVAGVVAPTSSALLQEAGVPEPFADIIGLGIGGGVGTKAPEIDVGKAKKPSGLTERGFESVTKPREVSEKKIGKINEALESDFKDISEKIIKESPIGETAENLKNDPTYKQGSRDLLDEAQQIANTISENIPSKSVKKELADISAKQIKGYALDDYGKDYLRFMKQVIEDIIPENITHGELVEQYRVNNKNLTEYFKPGESKAFNRAKRDALLDHNRAIAKVMEKTNPELSEVFKAGNERWTKIMDVEAIDKFIEEVFKDGINYKKLHNWFDKTGYDRIFKRALGDEGYKSFETLMKDMLTSEAPYKMLRVAKDKGLIDYAKLATGYLLKPIVGQAKLAIDLTKGTYKLLMNSMLEKPKLAFTWKKAVDNLKKGDFKASEKNFNDLNEAIKPDEIKGKGFTTKSSPEQPIDIEIKTEPIKEEPKRLEAPKKQIEFKQSKEKLIPKKDYEITTIPERERSKYSHIKKVIDKNGKQIGELTYDIEPSGELYISGIGIDENLSRKGIATELMKEILKEHGDKKIILSPLKPDGAKFFSNIFGKKFKPTLTENYDRIGKIKPKSISLTRQDIKYAKKKLGLEEKKPESKLKKIAKKIIEEKKLKTSNLENEKIDLEKARIKRDIAGERYNDFYYEKYLKSGKKEIYKKMLDQLRKNWDNAEKRVKEVQEEVNRLSEIEYQKSRKNKS